MLLSIVKRPLVIRLELYVFIFLEPGEFDKSHVAVAETILSTVVTYSAGNFWEESCRACCVWFLFGGVFTIAVD